MKNLIMDCINVGFGECIVLRHEEKTILIDGGDNLESKYNQVPYRTRLIDYLNHEGIDTIDLLVMTHPHRDHIGGFVEVVSSKQVKEAWYSVDCNMKVLEGDLVTGDNMYQAFSMHQTILESLAKQKTTIRKMTDAYLVRVGELSLQVYPPIGEYVREVEGIIESLDIDKGIEDNYLTLQIIDKKLNACSMVIAIQYGETRMLFTADALATYWEQVKEVLRFDFLKMPHHGDNHHHPVGFIQQVDPKHVVICADHIIGGISDERVAACVDALSEHIHIGFTEQSENSYNALRYTMDKLAGIESKPYKLKRNEVG